MLPINLTRIRGIIPDLDSLKREFRIGVIVSIAGILLHLSSPCIMGGLLLGGISLFILNPHGRDLLDPDRRWVFSRKRLSEPILGSEIMSGGATIFLNSISPYLLILAPIPTWTLNKIAFSNLNHSELGFRLGYYEKIYLDRVALRSAFISWGAGLGFYQYGPLGALLGSICLSKIPFGIGDRGKKDQKSCD